MKITLYMTTTANGFITDADGSVGWVSETAWENYKTIVQKVGAVIVGRNTYNHMPAEEFFDGVDYFVLTTKDAEKKSDRVTFLAGTPEDVVQKLEDAGVTEVCLTGGAKTIGPFMAAGLIDEIILDIEDIKPEHGVNLFNGEQRDIPYDVLSERQLTDKTIQVHFQKKSALQQ